MFWTYEHEAMLYTGLRLHLKLFHCGIERQAVLLMRQEAKEYLFPLGNRLYILAGSLFASDNFLYAERGKGRLLGLHAS